MKAIKAIYTGKGFEPQEPIPVNGKYEVVITFLGEISETAAEREERIAADMAFWRDFDNAIADAEDEVLNPEDFLICPETGERLILLADGTKIRRDGTRVGQ